MNIGIESGVQAEEGIYLYVVYLDLIKTDILKAFE